MSVNLSRLLSMAVRGVATIALFSADGAFAFHDGGAGECDGCHTIHNSSGGAAVTLNPLAPFYVNPYLLQASDPSSVCLNCHQQAGDTGPTSYHVSTPDAEMPPGMPPKQLTPGGDFGWLKKDFSWYAAFGQPMQYSYGEHHGHNIVSQDFGYLQDNTRVSAPGGSYPSISMSCISCHDPHGKYRRTLDGSIATTGAQIKGSGSYATSPDPDSVAAVGVYRMLGGVGYYPKSVGSFYAFNFGPPDAVAPDDYNRGEELTLTRVAYGSGMSQWCRNCHINIHKGAVDFTHPASAVLGAQLRSNYNSYVKTGDMTGMMETAYFSLVPFEVGTNNYATLKGIVTTTPEKGPDGADGSPRVSCLSCHRAHASGWDSATRWNTNTTYIVYNGSYSQAGEVYQPYGQGRTETEAARAYYETPVSKFAIMQEKLCDKCHVGEP